MKRLARVFIRTLALPVVLFCTAIIGPFMLHDWAFERSSIVMQNLTTDLKNYFKYFFK